MLDAELDRLLAGLCDGTLTEAETRQLGERIGGDPADRRAYLEYLDLHASLLGEATFAGVTESLGKLDPQVEVPQRGRRSALASPVVQLVALSLAVVLLAWGGLLWWNQLAVAPVAGPPAIVQGEPWARITDVVGSVQLAGANEPLHSGAELTADQTVRTGSDDSYAVIELADGGRLLLCPDSQLRLTRDVSAQRRLVLSAGVLEADVPTWEDDRRLIVVTPQAEISVRETRCVVSAADATSTVETTRGQVSVLRTADGQHTEVPAGYFTVAVHDTPDFSVRPVVQLPTQPHAQLALEQARTLAFRGEQQLVAASSSLVGRFDRKSQSALLTSPLSKDSSLHLVATTDGKRVAQIDRVGVVQLIDAESGSTAILDTGIRGGNAAALDSTGDLLAMSDRRSGWYSAAQLWDLQARVELPAIEILGSIKQLTLSRDGQQIALAIERTKNLKFHRVEIWKVNPPQLIQEIPLPERMVRVLAFTPDGHKLAGANDRGNVTVWDTRTGAELAQRDHTAGWALPLTSLAFNPAGDLLAAGSNNGRVRLWNVSTNQELGVLSAGTRIISALAFSPDGEELAVSAVRGKVLLYRFATSQNSASEL